MPVAEHRKTSTISECSGERYLLIANCFRYNQCGAICGTDAKVFVDVANTPLTGGTATAYQCSCCIQGEAVLQGMRNAVASAER